MISVSRELNSKHRLREVAIFLWLRVNFSTALCVHLVSVCFPTGTVTQLRWCWEPDKVIMRLDMILALPHAQFQENSLRFSDLCSHVAFTWKMRRNTIESGEREALKQMENWQFYCNSFARICIGLFLHTDWKMILFLTCFSSRRSHLDVISRLLKFSLDSDGLSGNSRKYEIHWKFLSQGNQMNSNPKLS